MQIYIEVNDQRHFDNTPNNKKGIRQWLTLEINDAYASIITMIRIDPKYDYNIRHTRIQNSLKFIQYTRLT